MGLFKKKEVKRTQIEKLPDLPELPQLPELPSLEELKPAKSSFSAFEAERETPKQAIFEPGISQFRAEQTLSPILTSPTISAVTKIPKTREISSDREIPTTMEISEWKPSKTPALNVEPVQKTKPETPEIQRSKPMSEMRKGAEKPKKTGPVFIRIDRFEDAASSFSEIKKKVSEIGALLKTLKEIKAREESEIGGWELELQKLKTRIEGIDRGLFSELD